MRLTEREGSKRSQKPISPLKLKKIEALKPELEEIESELDDFGPEGFYGVPYSTMRRDFPNFVSLILEPFLKGLALEDNAHINDMNYMNRMWQSGSLLEPADWEVIKEAAHRFINNAYYDWTQLYAIMVDGKSGQLRTDSKAELARNREEEPEDVEVDPYDNPELLDQEQDALDSFSDEDSASLRDDEAAAILGKDWEYFNQDFDQYNESYWAFDDEDESDYKDSDNEVDYEDDEYDNRFSRSRLHVDGQYALDEAAELDDFDTDIQSDEFADEWNDEQQILANEAEAEHPIDEKLNQTIITNVRKRSQQTRDTESGDAKSKVLKLMMSEFKKNFGIKSKETGSTQIFDDIDTLTYLRCKNKLKEVDKWPNILVNGNALSLASDKINISSEINLGGDIRNCDASGNMQVRITARYIGGDDEKADFVNYVMLVVELKIQSRANSSATFEYAPIYVALEFDNSGTYKSSKVDTNAKNPEYALAVLANLQNEIKNLFADCKKNADTIIHKLSYADNSKKANDEEVEESFLNEDIELDPADGWKDIGRGTWERWPSGYSVVACYNDDDGYDQANRFELPYDATFEDLENMLYDEGMVYVEIEEGTKEWIYDHPVSEIHATNDILDPAEYGFSSEEFDESYKDDDMSDEEFVEAFGKALKEKHCLHEDDDSDEKLYDVHDDFDDIYDKLIDDNYIPSSLYYEDLPVEIVTHVYPATREEPEDYDTADRYIDYDYELEDVDGDAIYDIIWDILANNIEEGAKLSLQQIEQILDENKFEDKLLEVFYDDAKDKAEEKAQDDFDNYDPY